MPVISILVVVAIVFAVIHHDERRYRIPSDSMKPTLNIGDRITVETDAYDDAEPKRGDIVVFHPPEGAEEGGTGQCGAPHAEAQMCATPTVAQSQVSFIKRVVAGPGDRIALRGGHLVLNGRLQAERYIATCEPVDAIDCDFPKPITVPRGLYFMLGDNRGASDDSRFWGAVPKDAIVGE